MSMGARPDWLRGRGLLTEIRFDSFWFWLNAAAEPKPQAEPIIETWNVNKNQNSRKKSAKKLEKNLLSLIDLTVWQKLKSSNLWFWRKKKTGCRPKSQQVGKFVNLSKAVTFDAPDKIDEKS